MRCLQCGTYNDDAARYCKFCSAPLNGSNASSTSIQTPMGSVDAANRGERGAGAPANAGYASLEDALYWVIYKEGPWVLRNQKRLLSLVSDLCDNSTNEYLIFEHNCDAEVLEPFARFLESSTDAHDLEFATNSATMVLLDRSIEQRWAESTAACIGRTVARIAGVELNVSHHDWTAPPHSVDGTASANASTQSRTNQRPAAQPSPQYAPRPQAEPRPRPVTQPVPQPRAVPVAQPQYTQPPRKGAPTGLVILLVIMLAVVTGMLGYSLAENRGTSDTQSSSSAKVDDSNSSKSTSTTSASASDTQSQSNNQQSEQSAQQQSQQPSVQQTTAPTPEQSAPEQTAPDQTTNQDSTTPTPELPLLWEGSYDGSTADDTPILRQLLFQFDDVSDSGDLAGVCYVGVIDDVPEATSGNFMVEGTVDWDTGAIHIWQTAWLHQGGLGPEREFMGTVDFSTGTMSGYLSTLGADNFDVAWRCSKATGQLEWRTTS